MTNQETLASGPAPNPLSSTGAAVWVLESVPLVAVLRVDEATEADLRIARARDLEELGEELDPDSLPGRIEWVSGVGFRVVEPRR